MAAFDREKEVYMREIDTSGEADLIMDIWEGGSLSLSMLLILVYLTIMALPVSRSTA